MVTTATDITELDQHKCNEYIFNKYYLYFSIVKVIELIRLCQYTVIKLLPYTHIFNTNWSDTYYSCQYNY